METGESGDTAISNQEIGFTREGKCLLPLQLGCQFLGWKPVQHVQKIGAIAMQKQNVH